MGDNDKDKIPEQPKQEQVKELKVTIIRNLESGQFSVQGPGDSQMYDKYLCLGLLEDARDYIKAHNAKMARNAIFTPSQKKSRNSGGAFGGRRF